MWLELFGNFRLEILTLYAFALLILLIFARLAPGLFFQRPLRAFFLGGAYFFGATICTGLLVQEIRTKTEEKLLGYAPTYARVVERMGHAQLTEDTSATSPVYQALIEMEKIWLAVNPFVSDIYTMKLNKAGQFYFMVDSETDYDRNGVFEGEREQRTAIGEVYDKDLDNLNRANNGTTIFARKIVQDRWGEWVSAYVPLYGPNGIIDGILGVDFNAHEYLSDQKRILWASGFFFELLLIFSMFLMKAKYRDELANQTLSQALTLSEEAKNTKSRFLATMSHEVRTPLNGILGAVDLIRRDPRSGDVVEYFKIIESCSVLLLDLVNDVLDFSKLESERLSLEEIPFSPRGLAESSLKAIQLKALENQVALEIQIEGIDDQMFLGDPTRLRQILLNLLSNAVKFTREGTVTLKLSRTATARLEISVADTGTGMSPEGLAKLFQSFSQVDASTTRKYGGTGLGLAITKALVELMGGIIEVHSELGVGSVFTLSIPAREAPAKTSVVKTCPELSVTRLADKWPLRIMVVDDNQVNRIILERYLSRMGYSCRLACDGMEMLKALEQESCDVVFLDGHMPRMDGYEAAHALRQRAEFSQIKIIAVTASSGIEERDRFMEAGADDFVLKPASLQQIHDSLLKLCLGNPSSRKAA